MKLRFAALAALACAGFAVAAAPVSAAPASALGPQVKIGEPRDGFVGKLDVVPSHGKAGDPFTVTGVNLPPNQEFQLIWRTVEGRWNVGDAQYKGREFAPVAYQMTKVKTDTTGKFRSTFTTPEDFGFGNDIVLQQGNRLVNQAGYSIDMTVDVTPKAGPAGTPIHVTVKGIGWRSLYNSWDLIYDNNFTGWLSAVTTHGTAEFTIPATGGAGDHVLEIVHGALVFPYRNPEQNPAPGRPRFSTMFHVTPGPAVLPAAPQQQAQRIVRVLPPQGELVSTPHFSGVGEPIKVRGQGFEPGKVYKLNWTHVVGNRVGGQGWEESAKEIAQAKADASGRVEFSFNTPDDLGGTHGMFVQEGAKKKIGTHLIKSTALPLDVTHGPVGTKFTIHLKGVGWTETANIMHVVYDNNYTGYACAFNSQGDVTIYMQATGAPGWHYIDLYPGIYKGSEREPNNYEIPQLTYADDHPGEDLPAFHFAFEVTPSRTAAAAPPPSHIN
jgi:hypothetical protein